MNHPVFHVFILCVGILIAYFGTWNGYFLTVDDYLLTGLTKQRATLGEAAMGLENGVRYLTFAMIWVKTRLFDMNFAAWMWCGLLQHAIVTYLVYRFAEIMTKHRLIALLAALLFAMKSSYWQILIGASASDYSFWAIFHLLTVTLFAAFLHRRSRLAYVVSIGSYSILAFGHDFSLNVPLILLAYHILVGRDDRSIRSLRLSELKIHFPYFIIWGIHVALQLRYVLAGSSEAVFSEQAYGPGLHMIRNLYFLVFLVFPNIPIYSFLSRNVNPAVVNGIGILTSVLAVIFHMVAIYLFWKGSRLVKFAVSMIYLPFLQYTLWGGDFAGVSRYLYLPSIGFSILLALLLRQLYEYLQRKRWGRYRLIVFSIVITILIFNVVTIQIWMNRHLSNSEFRRTFVNHLMAQYSNFDSNDRVYIEVSEDKYADLGFSCELVFENPPQCEAVVTGERAMIDVIDDSVQESIYWLQVTSEGVIVQQFPPPSAN